MNIYRISSFISYILHPAVLIIVTVIIMSSKFRQNLLYVIFDTGVMTVSLLPGLLYVFFKTKSGEFSHYHLLFLKERNVALPLLFIGLGTAFIFFWAAAAPLIILNSLAIALIVGFGAIIISRFWKISLHAAVAMGCSVLLAPVSINTAIFFGVLAIITGISRIIVKHHTYMQVFTGWLYSLIFTSLLLLKFKLFVK